MIRRKDNTFLREIPSNLLIDEKVVNLSKSLQSALDKMDVWSEKINYTTNIDNLEEEIIDHLLWENHILPHEGLYLAENLQEKRELLKIAVEYHRTKGTKYAVERMISAFFKDAKVREWFEFEGIKKYQFLIEVKSEFKRTQDLARVFKLINAAKNKRSRLRGITFKSEVGGEDLNIELVHTDKGIAVYLIIAFFTGILYSINSGHADKSIVKVINQTITGDSCYRVTTNKTKTSKHFFVFLPEIRTGDGLYYSVSNDSAPGIFPFRTNDGYASSNDLLFNAVRTNGESCYRVATKNNNGLSEKLLFSNESNVGESLQLICGDAYPGETAV